MKYGSPPAPASAPASAAASAETGLPSQVKLLVMPSLNGSVARDHNDFGRIVELANPFQSLQAVDTGQPDIEQHDVKWGFAQKVEARFAAPRRSGGIPFVSEDAGEGVANSVFVINDEDVMHGGRRPLPAWVRGLREVRR